MKRESELSSLTEREQAILIWAAVSGITDWKRIYILSRDASAREYAPPKNFAKIVSEWKHRDRVMNFFLEQRQIQELRIANAVEAKAKRDRKEKEQKERDAERTARNGTSRIDFLNRAELLEHLNDQANLTDDVKVRTDLLKMISDLLRMKEDDRKEVDLQRFYMPLKCNACKLYELQRQALERTP